MKSYKRKKITDEMIGMDDKICSCSSIVGDIIISEENKEGKTSLRKIMDSLRKNEKRSNLTAYQESTFPTKKLRGRKRYKQVKQ